MNFFRTLKDSVYGPAFYAGLPERPISSSVWYLVGVSAMVGIIMAILFVPGIFGFFSPSLLDKAYDAYPDDLIVTFDKGAVSINQPEPYSVPAPWTVKEGEPKNLVVFDTLTPFSPEQLDTYSTAVLVKKEFAVADDENKGDRIMPFKDIPHFVLSEEVVRGWGAKLAPYLTPLAIASSIGFAFFLFLGDLFTLVYLFFAALLVFVVLKLLKRNFDYGNSYKAALHAATLPMLLGAFLFLFRIHMPLFTYTLLLLLIVVLNLKGRASGPTTVPTETKID